MYLEKRDGGVAQLGEHLPCKQGVRSSILLISTTSVPLDRGRYRAARLRKEDAKWNGGRRQKNYSAKPA